MKKYLLLPFIVFLTVCISFGQSKNSDDVKKKIKELKSEKSIFWEEPEPGWNSSKITAVGKNFSEAERRRTGVEELDFALAVFLQYYSFNTAPKEIVFTFRVKNKNPRFAESHAWTLTIGSETLDLGDARYSARARDHKEFLNFKISRENLEKIAKSPDVKFKIGNAELKFSAEHLRLLTNFLIVTNPATY